jgi:hypothetical protein
VVGRIPVDEPHRNPDIRSHADTIRDRIELDMRVGVNAGDRDARAELRRWLDTGAPPLPSLGREPIAP